MDATLKIIKYIKGKQRLGIFEKGWKRGPNFNFSPFILVIHT